MGALRKQKDLVKSRRRVTDDGEEEEGPLIVGGDEDSLSEDSGMSDADDDADAEGSDGSDTGSLVPGGTEGKLLANGHQQPQDAPPLPSSNAAKPLLEDTLGDTEAMINGLRISDEPAGEGIAFDDLSKEPTGSEDPNQADAQQPDTLAERRRREHEEYKKRRDADPAFVPNRGGFFMHDHRSAAPGQNGFRPYGRGRGRGRGGPGGPFPSSNYAQPTGPVDAPWSHDLHESVTEPERQTAVTQVEYRTVRDTGKALTPGAKAQPPNRSFSKTTLIGNMQVRVFLPGMTDPITFSGVPVHQHTRLPHHRPPLRRDKPVRISLPNMAIRYIFPATERSFIFIPRALRPNQQGFGRVRGRGSFGGGYGGFGPLSSRRTSAYAGSAYSPSIAMSRRSSLAREVTTTGFTSPSGVPASQQAVVPMEPGKPVVRLPPAVEQMQTQATAMNGGPPSNMPQTYPLPQKPTFRENRPTELQMHHPKPERSLHVADIESPATFEFNPPPPQQQQPFHQQVPLQVAGPGYPPDPLQYPHSRHPSHPSQASGGTPLPQIPERAIHAQPFQPYPYQQPQGFYPPHYPPPMYFYPHADHGMVPGNAAAAPPFVPGQPYFYPMAIAPAAPPPLQAETTTQSGTIAQESNGTVYYYNPSDLAASTDGHANFSPAYGMPPGAAVGGMGGMMTPPMQYFPPQPTVYYPPQ